MVGKLGIEYRAHSDQLNIGRLSGLSAVLDQVLDEGQVIGRDLTSTDDKGLSYGIGYNNFFSRTLLKNGGTQAV
jgi:hypothetical protein